jgi:tetratricopeptide (TPR) repeat protein
VAATRAFGANDWLFIVALVVAVFLIYQPVWQGQLLWDDAAHVTRPELRSWHGLYRIWFEVGATQQYYPLSESAFWLQYKLWGDAMTGYHLVNIALHALAAVMVALVLRQLAIPGPYLAAAVFALHPVNVESVAWITEQKNTLSAVFYLGAAMAYLRFDRNRNTAWYLGALGLFALSLLGKIVTVTLPAALLVIFWWQRGKLSWRRDVLPLTPFFAIGVVLGVFITWVERTLLGAEGPDFALTVVQRCLLAGRVVWFYLGKLLWPADLQFLYPRWEISAAVWWQYLFPLALLILLGVLWRLSRRWRGPLAGFLFFAGTLFPVLGFLNVYWFTFSYVADHFQYLASLGIIALAAAGTALRLTRWRLWNRPGGYAVCLVVLAVLAGLTWRQSRIYADAETLCRTTIDRNPTCWIAYTIFGNLLQERGQVEEAIAQYRKALEINRDHAEPYYNLGNALVTSRRADEAITQYQKALEILPGYVDAQHSLGLALAMRGRFDEAIAQYRKALQAKPNDVNLLNHLALALHDQGHVSEALVPLEKALQIKPDDAPTRKNLGLFLVQVGRPDEAIAHYQKALEIDPADADGHNNLGAALADRGRIDEAVAEYQKALEIDPQFAKAHSNLGIALTRKGRFDEAITHYRKAAEISPHEAEFHYNLGNALARQGRLDEALAEYRETLSIKPDHANARFNLGVALCQQGKVSEGIAQLREVIRLQPDNILALNQLASILATDPGASIRNGAQAVELAERAAKLTAGREPVVLDTLAAALAEAGRFPEAVKTAEQALDLASRQRNAALADTLRTRIKMYQNNVPYRDAEQAISPQPIRP